MFVKVNSELRFVLVKAYVCMYGMHVCTCSSRKNVNAGDAAAPFITMFVVCGAASQAIVACLNAVRTLVLFADDSLL